MSGHYLNVIDDDDHLVQIILDNKMKFYCDRRHLVEKSRYFAAMFETDMVENRSGIVHLHEVGSLAMNLLIKYLKSEDLQYDILTKLHVVPKLLEAAVMLQFDEVVSLCVDKLRTNLCIDNCLGFMNLAERLSLRKLQLQAKQTAMWYFDQVALGVEIVNVPVQYLVEYLSGDSLRTKSEMDVFSVIVRWIENVKTERFIHLEDLIGVVRFSTLTLKDIRTISVHVLIRECPFVHRIIREIWMIKLNEQSMDRFDGCSRSVTPLSNVSPADSLPDLVGDQSNDSSDDAVPQNKRIRIEGADLLSVDIRKEIILARRLLMMKSRYIKTVPAFIRVSNSLLELPGLFYFDERDGGHVKRMCAFENVRYHNSTFKNFALGFKACAVGNFVVVIGGEFRDDWNVSMWKYNIFTKVWTLFGQLRNPRRHHLLCSLDDDFVYIIGGISRFRTAIDTVEKVCIKTGNSTELLPLPVQVCSSLSVAVAYEGKIYVFVSGHDVYRYDPWTDIWCHPRYLDLPTNGKIEFNAAIAHQNGIYLVSNSKNAHLILLDINWKKSKEIGQFSRSSMNVCLANNKIYSFTMRDCQSQLIDGLIVESYDIASGVFAVEYEEITSDKNKPLEDMVHYGCFPLPKYFLN